MAGEWTPVGALQPERRWPSVPRAAGVVALLLGVGLGLIAFALVGCGQTATLTGLAAATGLGVGVAPGPAAGLGHGAETDPGAGLTVTWASVEYVAAPAGDVTAVLDVVVDNHSTRGTQSTSILWEPAFAGAFTFVVSDPTPWRFRIDERGWGVLDTEGIQPGRSDTFRLRFTSPAPAAFPPVEGSKGGPGLQSVAGPPVFQAGTAPRIVVVVNGERVVAATVANLRPLGSTGFRPAQDRFERGPLASLADVIAVLPVDGRQAFPFAAGLGAVLGVLVAGGAGAALRLTVAAPPSRRRYGATGGDSGTRRKGAPAG